MAQTSVVKRKRIRLFTMRMNDEERARLALIAKRFRLTSADVIRVLLQREVYTSRGERVDSAKPGRAD